MSTPVLDEYDDNLIGNWGRPRVIVGGEDVTFFPTLDGRPVATVIHQVRRVKEGSYGAASITITGINPLLEKPGEGRLAFLKRFVQTKIEQVSTGPSPAVRGTVHRGNVAAWRGTELGLQVMQDGRLDYLKRQIIPPLLERVMSMDLAEAMTTLVNSTDHQPNKDLRLEPANLETGIEVNLIGEWESRYAMIVDLLAQGVRADGTSYTLRYDDAAGPVLCADTPRNEWFVMFGQAGVQADLETDHTQATTAIFATGIGTRGDAWGNAKYPWARRGLASPLYPSVGDSYGPGDSLPFGVGRPLWKALREGNTKIYSTPTTYDGRDAKVIRNVQDDAGLDVTGRINAETWAAVFTPGDEVSTEGAFYYPLAKTKDWDRYKRTADGARLGANPNYDRWLLPGERLIQFPEGISKKQAREACRAILDREREAPTHGTIVLSIDPRRAAGGDGGAIGSRLDIVEGDTLRLKNYLGDTLHLFIAEVVYDFESLNVTLTVSTRSGTFATVADEIDKRRGTRQARRQANGQRINGPKIVVDSESPAGIVPEHAHSAKEGLVVYVPSAPVSGTFVRSRFAASIGTEFIMALFEPKEGVTLTPALVEGVIGKNPFDFTDEDDGFTDPTDGHLKGLREIGFVEWFGSKSSPLGYGEEQKKAVPDEPDALGGDPSPSEIEAFEKAIADRAKAIAFNAAHLDGTWREDYSWDYVLDETSRPYLLAVIWTKDACTFEGRFLPGAQR